MTQKIEHPVDILLIQNIVPELLATCALAYASICVT